MMSVQYRQTMWYVVVSLSVLFFTHSGAGDGGGGAPCPERNGRFPVSSQCDAYIECVDGVGEQKLCPEGLLFNAKTPFFTYPCQYPAEVDCEGRSGLQPAQPTEECPHQFGYFKEGDVTHCGQFKNCVNGRGYIFDCPEGLAFNDYTLRCDWPDLVETCDAEAFLGFTCPNNNPNSIFGPEGYRFFRNPSNCQKYFICINGRPRLFSCGEGYAFNEDISSCDGVENVTGCALPPQAGPQRVDLFNGRKNDIYG